MSRQLLWMTFTVTVCGCDSQSQPLTGPRAVVRDSGAAQSPADRARGYLGLYFESIDDTPLVVAGCVPDSGAELAGILPGDLLIGLNGHDRPTFLQIHQMTHDSKPGDQLSAVIERKGQSISIAFELISFDEVQAAMERMQSTKNNNE